MKLTTSSFAEQILTLLGPRYREVYHFTNQLAMREPQQYSSRPILIIEQGPHYRHR